MQPELRNSFSQLDSHSSTFLSSQKVLRTERSELRLSPGKPQDPVYERRETGSLSPPHPWEHVGCPVRSRVTSQLFLVSPWGRGDRGQGLNVVWVSSWRRGWQCGWGRPCLTGPGARLFIGELEDPGVNGQGTRGVFLPSIEVLVGTASRHSSGRV